MGDMMSFPDTFEEFAEQYKIVDKQQIYTNGTEMIPIFRVKQWLYERPTADVVPKSEVDDWIITAKENLIRIEELEEDLKNAKAEVAREIFEEIEKLLRIGVVEHSDCLDGYVKRGYAELKKKYTEEKE